MLAISSLQARTLAVIMADREEKEACRVITPTADAAK